MKIEELANCPDWLKEAVTENADVDIIEGVVHWHSGTWHSGVWENGVWETGLWKGGTWKHGLWKSGTWEGGTWHSGTWRSGTWNYGTWNDGRWREGTWCNGIWEDGHWYSGYWNNGTWYDGFWHNGTWDRGSLKKAHIRHQRFKYSPALRADNSIIIGCQTKTREQWDAWFAGDEEFETPRNSEEFKLIEANYIGFIAYAEQLNLIPKK